MIEVNILVPVADNDGLNFTPNDFRTWEDELASLFGGFSLLPGHVKGAWIDNDRRYDDTLRTYVVVIGNITEGDKVGRAVEAAKRLFRQEAIYFRALGVATIL